MSKSVYLPHTVYICIYLLRTSNSVFHVNVYMRCTAAAAPYDRISRAAQHIYACVYVFKSAADIFLYVLLRIALTVRRASVEWILK